MTDAAPCPLCHHSLRAVMTAKGPAWRCRPGCSWWFAWVREQGGWGAVSRRVAVAGISIAALDTLDGYMAYLETGVVSTNGVKH